jgi:hypothetical protein
MNIIIQLEYITLEPSLTDGQVTRITNRLYAGEHPQEVLKATLDDRAIITNVKIMEVK